MCCASKMQRRWCFCCFDQQIDRAVQPKVVKKMVLRNKSTMFDYDRLCIFSMREICAYDACFASKKEDCNDFKEVVHLLVASFFLLALQAQLSVHNHCNL